jgi:hypothetical protein
MKKLVLISFWGLFLYPDFYAQQPAFGTKIFGGCDIVSDVFFIQDGFVLDSLYSGSEKYQFEYYENGRLKKDSNFVRQVFHVEIDGRSTWKNFPGTREYLYNEKEDIDSVRIRYFIDSLGIDSYSGYRINYSYDGEGKILSKTYSSNGITTEIEENSYDSTGNLILNKIILISDERSDTTYNLWEYDLHERLSLKKSVDIWGNTEEFIYSYDSVGNVNCIYQEIENGDTDYVNYYSMEFDESGRMVYQLFMEDYNPDDSTSGGRFEINFNYDEEGKIMQMGDACWFRYNSNGNLDSLVNMHSLSSGYLAGRFTFVDSYDNQITLPNKGLGENHFYYSGIITDIETREIIEKDYLLSQNYPNPFNPSTRIKFLIPSNERTRQVVNTKIIVYDILGKVVKNLLNENLIPGNYEVEFNGSDLPSGVYFYQLTLGNSSEVKKMILLK